MDTANPKSIKNKRQAGETVTNRNVLKNVHQWRTKKIEEKDNSAKTMQNNSEIVIYQSQDGLARLDVRLDKETVWLTQQQIADLFGVQIPAISKHLSNIFKEGELDKNSVISILENTAKDGKVYRTQFYNLDAILSVGYRVNSVYATQFRQWATKVLNNYLKYGYAISNRFERLEQRVAKTEAQIESFVHAALPPREGIFVDGQIFDAFEFIERLIKSAQKSILLIDNYVDESVLTMMSEKQTGVNATIYTKEISNALQLAQKNFNTQYGGLTLQKTQAFHDRFLIIDDKTIYLIGASMKDAGKRLFAFTQMDSAQIKTIKAAL